MPLTMSYTASAPTLHATIASISTPVRALVRASATSVTVPASGSTVTAGSTCVNGSECASGISSSVRLAAWIAARRATVATSPFCASPAGTAAAAGVVGGGGEGGAARAVAGGGGPGRLAAAPAEPLDVAAVSAAVRDPRAGAVVCFEGVTREVEALDYEAYAEMATAKLRE